MPSPAASVASRIRTFVLAGSSLNRARISSRVSASVLPSMTSIRSFS